MKTTAALTSTAYGPTTYRSNYRPIAKPNPAKADAVIRLIAYFMFVGGLVRAGLLIIILASSGGSAGLMLGGIMSLVSLPNVILAVGLVRMRRWSRNLTAIFQLLGLALQVLGMATSPLSATAVAGLVLRAIVIAWLAYRWERFR